MAGAARLRHLLLRHPLERLLLAAPRRQDEDDANHPAGPGELPEPGGGNALGRIDGSRGHRRRPPSHVLPRGAATFHRGNHLHRPEGLSVPKEIVMHMERRWVVSVLAAVIVGLAVAGPGATQ